MNIKEAKIQISNTLKAYLTKDELGNYLIPTVRQRPVLLMGPPGVGKTQIMEQIAAEENVGLVAYTITHHTRQSAIGLPFIEKHSYDGVEYSITEYTMSEIIGSVHQLMEKTGIREGILFIDEINCVSETLAPMMLQFLQCKTFGNQKLPEGWLIVAAGNPPEYNRSVRDFDVVTLDRVKKINVEENFAVWKEYALRRGLHGAVVSYLDIKKDNFYHIENTTDGLAFATARGWEDLSEIIYAYEKLGLKVDHTVTEQYIQLPRIARDFANYLALYYKYQKNYHVDEILNGTWEHVTAMEFAAAPFDEKLSVMSLLMSRMSEASRNTRSADALAELLHDDLLEFKAEINNKAPVQAMNELLNAAREDIKKAVAAGQIDKESRNLKQKRINELENYIEALKNNDVNDRDEAMTTVKELFAKTVNIRRELGSETGEFFNNAFAFLEHAVGQSQEMVMFVTEITAGYDTSWFIDNFGCDAYYKNNSELLLDNRRKAILDEITSVNQ